LIFGGLHPARNGCRFAPPPTTTPQATRQFAAYCAPSLDDEHGHAILRLSMSPLFDILIHNMRTAAGCGAAEGGGGIGGGGGSGAASGNGTGRAQPKAFFYSGHGGCRRQAGWRITACMQRGSPGHVDLSRHFSSHTAHGPESQTPRPNAPFADSTLLPILLGALRSRVRLLGTGGAPCARGW
jgi:hypothetical protein